MKMHNTIIFVALIAVAMVAVPSVHAQRQLGKKKGPTSKLYLAETQGEGQIITEGKAMDPKQATAFDAPGTIIETKDDAHQAFVYSNGTGMYVDSNTRVVIDRFVQEPFNPDRSNSDMEPSVSQSDVFVARGSIGICTGQLVSGSTMNYSTAQATVNIRGGKLSMTADSNSTTVYLLDGDATVRTGGNDQGGTLLHPGEQAVIRPGLAGQPPTVTVGPIDSKVMSALDEKVSIACNAKKTVSFDVIDKKAAANGLSSAGEPPSLAAGQTTTAGTTPANAADATQSISAHPTISTTPPTNITVSPDRLPGGE
ncbi:MAG: hypothetical protein ACHQ5A_03640 [Opitutales bacterium]